MAESTRMSENRRILRPSAQSSAQPNGPHRPQPSPQRNSRPVVPRRSRAETITLASLAVVSGIVGMLGVLKVNPTMSVLIAAGMIEDATAGGWLITVLSLAGLALALPGGGLVDRFGARRVIMAGLACGMLGNLLGFLAPAFLPLLLTRLLEGVCIGLVSVAGPSLLAELFSSEKRGIPMALWTSQCGIAMLVLNCMASALVDPGSPDTWKNMWIACLVVEAALLVLFAIFGKGADASAHGSRSAEDDSDASPGESNATTPSAAALSAAVPDAAATAAPAPNAAKADRWLPSASTCMLGLVLMIYAVCFGSVIAFTSLYCTEGLGMSFVDANNYSNAFAATFVVGGLAIGVLAQKLSTVRQRIAMLTASMAVTTAIGGTCFIYSVETALPYLLVAGLFMQCAQAMVFIIAPSTASSPRHVGMTMGVMSLFNNLGGFGPTMTGALITGWGFVSANMVLLMLGLVGTALSAMLLFLMCGRRKAA